MRSFREFFFKEYSGSGYAAGFNPWQKTAQYGFGQDMNQQFRDRIPVGGYKDMGQFAQHHSNRKRMERGFDLVSFCKELGVKTDKAQRTIVQFGGSGNESVITYPAMNEYLRQLWSRTDNIVSVLSSHGTTPDGWNPERIKGSHFKGQGPSMHGDEPGVDKEIIMNVDKRVFIGEAGGGPQGGSFEIGTAIYAITPNKEDPPDVKNKEGTMINVRFDIDRIHIRDALQLFGKWNFEFEQRQALLQHGAAKGGQAWQKMVAGGSGMGLGSNLAPLAQGN